MRPHTTFTGHHPESHQSHPPPADLCPNCWGTQAYAGAFLEAAQTERLDLNNALQKVGWIQAYAAEHFEGIQRHQIDELLECSSFRLTYRPV